METHDRLHLAPAFFFALLLGVLALLIAAGPGEAATNPALTVRSTVLVNSGRVDASCLLGPEASPHLRKQLEQIPVGFIARPLGEIAMTREDLKNRLGSLGRLFVIPPQLKFLRRGDILPGKEITGRLTKLLQAQVPEIPANELEISFRRVPSHLILPGPLVKWTIEPLSSQKLGMQLFSLEAETEGGKVRQLVQVDVARKIKAARVVRLVKPGEIFGAEDLRPYELLIRTDHDRQPLAMDQVIGRTAASVKSPGALIRGQDIKEGIASQADGSPGNIHPGNSSGWGTTAGKVGTHESWLVSPGEQVEYQVRSGGLKLQVPARAIQGGAVGDQIRLVNLQNQRTITGTVSGPGKVEFHD